MAKSAILSIKILTDASKAQQGMDQAAGKVGKFQSGLGKAGKIGAVAFAAVGAAAISAAKAAAEDQQAQAILAKTLKNTTGATDAQVAATEDWITKTAAATGVADDSLRPALGNLVRATGDVTKSQDAMSVALDVAAATGQDVETVSKALAKGYGGNTKALGKLVPGMDKAVLSSGDMSKVMAELQRTTGGAAAAAANTAAGKWQRFQLAMSEAKEGAGAALLPALTALTGVLVTVGNLAQKHSTAFVILAAAIGGIALAVMAANAAISIYTAVTTVAGAVSGAAWAAALGPILLVIAAIALVVGGIILLWKRSETFRNVVLAVWAAIRSAAQAVGRFLVSAWRVVWTLLSAYVRAYVLVFKVAFNIILAVARAVASAAAAAWRAFQTAVSRIAAGVKAAWTAVWSALARVADAAATAFRRPFDQIKSAVQSVIDAVERLIGKIRSIKLPHISIPGVGSLGAASAPASLAATSRGTLARGSVGSRTVATGGTTIVVQGAVDPESTARQIRRILTRHDQRVGLTGAALRTGLV